jgi:hypothetical protein
VRPACIRQPAPFALAAAWPEGRSARASELRKALDEGHADANTLPLLLIGKKHQLSPPASI